MIHLTVQQLSASLDGALTGPSLELIVRHLAACHVCRDRQARLAKHDDALRRLLGQEPSDGFLDDLTRRVESLATAISRGMPAPIMETSVPLLHEEDPYAPAEPQQQQPDLGKPGDIAFAAGWGRIGLKPSAPGQAPPSDPGEAKRLLDATAGGRVEGATRPGAQGSEPNTEDGPVFELPAWFKDQPVALPSTQSPREVPKVDFFIEHLEDHAAGGPPSEMPNVFPGRSWPATPRVESGPPAPEPPAAEAAVNEPVPPSHTAYAPPGWSDDSATPEELAPEPPAPSAYAPPGWSDGSATPEDEPVPPSHAAYAPPGWSDDSTTREDVAPEYPEPSAYAPSAPVDARAEAGWSLVPAPDATSEPPAWGAPPASHDPGGSTPGPEDQAGGSLPQLAPVSVWRRVRALRLDPVASLAIASVCALLLLMLILQLVPAGSRSALRAGARASTGGRLQQVQTTRPGDARQPAPGAPPQRTRSAETPPPVDAVVPATPIPVPADTMDRHSPGAASAAAVTPPPAAQPAAGTTSSKTTSATSSPISSTISNTNGTTHTAAQAARRATPPAPALVAQPAADTTSGATSSTIPSATRATHAAAKARRATPRAPAPSGGKDTGAARAAAEDDVWPLLCGQIVDDAGEPVAGARVAMAEIKFETFTDARGRFCVSAPTGAHVLSVASAGFTPRQVPVTLSSSSADVGIRLQAVH